MELCITTKPWGWERAGQTFGELKGVVCGWSKEPREELCLPRGEPGRLQVHKGLKSTLKSLSICRQQKKWPKDLKGKAFLKKQNLIGTHGKQLHLSHHHTFQFSCVDYFFLCLCIKSQTVSVDFPVTLKYLKCRFLVLSSLCPKPMRPSRYLPGHTYVRNDYTPP